MDELKKAAVEGLKEAASPGRVFQFTPEANRRVGYSYHEDELRQVTFYGRNGVDLLEVESAILAIDQREGRRNGLAVDEEYGPELADCNVGSEDVCVKKFLPTQWDGKSKYQAGYFSSDLALPGKDDSPLVVCFPCRQAVNREIARENRAIEEQNKKLLADGKEPKPLLLFPRYMSLRDAEETYSRKVAAVRRKEEWQAAAYQRRKDGEASRRRFIGRISTSAQAIAWAKKRYGDR